MRRILAGLSIVALLAFFAYLLLDPLGRPKAALVVARPIGEIASGVPDTLPFAAHDVSALVAATEGKLLGPAANLSADNAPAETFGSILQQSYPACDVLVVYVRAVAAVDDGRAVLLWGNEPGSTVGRRYLLRDLLASLGEHPAARKVLLLDTCDAGIDRRAGRLGNDFASALEAACKNGPEGIWVLAPHQAGETAHVSPALGRSVFGYWISRGLGGAADLDRSGYVHLQELHQYVASGVSAWVRQTTGRRESQTPRLIACGSRDRTAADPLLVPARRRFRMDVVDEQVALNAALNVARERRESQATAAASDADLARGAASPEIAGPAGETASAQATASVETATDAAAAPDSTDSTSGESVAEGDAVPAALSARPSTPAELLDAGWTVRDDLERGNAARPDPRRNAPHLWRACVQRLLALETAAETGSARERDAATNELSRLVPSLRRWAAGGGPEPDAPEPVRSLTMIRAPEPTWQAISLGLAEAEAAAGHLNVPPEVATLIAEFDRLVSSSGTAEEFSTWLSERAPQQTSYVELVLARQLIETPGLDWDIVQEALSTRRLAEQVAASVEAATWLSTPIKEADVLRSAAERLLLDDIGRNRQTIAQELLSRARQNYDEAASLRTMLREAKSLRNDLFDRLPEIIAWHRRSEHLPGPRSPQKVDVLALLGAAEELASLLETPSADALSRVEAAAARTRTQLATVERGLASSFVRNDLVAPPDSADDFLRIQALLSTSLPTAADRIELREAARRADAALATRLPWNELRRSSVRSVAAGMAPPQTTHFEIEYRLARLAVGEASRERLAALSTAYEALTGDNDAGGGTARRFAAALGDFWRRTLPSIVRSTPATRADQRSRLAELRAAERALRLIDDRDAVGVTPLPTTLLDTELRANLLHWQSLRFQRERDAAPSDQRRSWELLASMSLQAAEQMSHGEFVPPTPSLLAIEGPSLTSLEFRETADVAMTVSNRSDKPLDVWLVVDHDPSLVAIGKSSVEWTPAFRLRRQRDGGVSPTAVAATSLNRPDRDGNPPALRLPPLGKDTLELPLARVAGAGRPTRLIVRALARPAESNEAAVDVDSDPVASDVVSIVRGDVVIPLPSVAPAELIVEGPPGSVGGTPGALVASPYPNRVTPFRLFLANRTGSSATVDVSVFAATHPAGVDAAPREIGELPTEIGIDGPAAASLLARWTDGAALFSATEMALPADGTPVPLPFPKPVPSGAPDPAVEQGLLVVVTDRATGRLSVQPLLFRPQHPRRYLEPVVQYDAEIGRIEIRVLPRSDALLPPGGSRVSCEVVGSLPAEATRRLEGVILSADRPAELFVETGGIRDDAVVLQLTVDGYPRAFHYRVPLTGTRSNIPPETGASAVRVRAPLPGTAFKTPLASVPVAIEVDAPMGARWTGSEAVEIGFDRDRDRELRGEETILLHSDRQIAVSVREMAPGGSLAVACTVSDFQIDLPADHLDRGRVNLIGRLVTSGRSVWSAPVELVFDDVPPPVRRIYLSRQRVVAGEPLQVRAEVSDSGLSGVTQVLVGVDLARTGEFAEEPKPVPAIRERGRWIAMIDTAALLPGTYYVLVRAIDAVGIPGPYARERFEVVTPEQMAAAEAAAVNRVSGFVNYRGRPMSGFEVLLEPMPAEAPAETGAAPAAATNPASGQSSASIPPATTDEQGAFTISKVPPGRYQVSATGLYANGNRTGTVEVTVPPFPADVPPVEIEVDPR